MRGTETNTVSCICILSFMSTGETIHWTESTNLTLLWGSRQRCVCVCWVGADSTNLKICLMWHSAYLEMFYIFFFIFTAFIMMLQWWVLIKAQCHVICGSHTHTHPTNWSHRYYFIIIISITCCMWWCYTHTTHTFPQRKSIQEPCEIEFERERERASVNSHEMADTEITKL